MLNNKIMIIRILLNLSIILMLFWNNIDSYAARKKANDDDPKAKIFALMKQKKWPEANKLANKLANKSKESTLKKIVLSQQFLDTKYKNNSFEKITAFLRENPEWPQNYSLRLQAEKLINSNTKKAEIIKWFNKNKPLTGKGYIEYALAAPGQITDKTKRTKIIKDGWHYGDFTREEQKSYYKKFKQYLDHADHVKKIDNHLWKKEITKAKNILYIVNDGYKKSFEAQIALIQNKKNARKLFKKIAQKYYTSGLIYHYLCSRKQDIPSGAEIAKLSRIAAKYPERADSIWKVQNYLTRELLEKKKYRDAYKAASAHFCTNPVNKSEAESLLGWIALNYLKKPDLALTHFRNFNRIVKTPISKSRGIYWLARTHEQKKNTEKAQKLYNLAATKYPYTFYGQLSAIELGHNRITLPNDIVHNNENITSYLKNSEITRAAQIVAKYGSNNLAQIYITTAVRKAKNTNDIYAVIGAVAKLDNIHHTVWAAKNAIHKHVFVTNHAFPTPYMLKNLPIETPLTYSIIRQESVFDQFAMSNANAMGLMQLIKPTACETAQILQMRCRVSSLTGDPKYNIKLGSNHLNRMIDEYDGSYILAIASYNGGPHNVNKWLKRFGDPRKLQNHRDVINWLEHIPFYETRNYVQRVLENLQIYRSILNRDSKLRLSDDLTHKTRKKNEPTRNKRTKNKRQSS